MNWVCVKWRYRGDGTTAKDLPIQLQDLGTYMSPSVFIVLCGPKLAFNGRHTRLTLRRYQIRFSARNKLPSRRFFAVAVGECRDNAPKQDRTAFLKILAYSPPVTIFPTRSTICNF
jgi:hypothetical protein